MEEQPRTAFGMHLTLDGYECQPECLCDLDVIYRFLDSCPDLIGMTKIMPPYVFKYKGQVPKDWGLSGFVLIAESHISIHTFPDRRYLSIDIFSCNDFTHEVAVGYAVEMFGMARHESRMFDRGLEFPRNQDLVEGIMMGERKCLQNRGPG